MKTTLELIAPVPEFDEAAFIKTVNNFLDETAQAMQADYYVTVKTWKHPVDFIINNFGQYGRDIFTWDDKYMFVSEGTRVRYVTMTPNFQAKTTPGVIRSTTGRGGVAYFSRAQPKPGIQARRFAETINAKWERMYDQQWDRAVVMSPEFWI